MLVFSQGQEGGLECNVQLCSRGVPPSGTPNDPGSDKTELLRGEMLEVINSSTAIALLAASEIFSMAQRKDLVEAVLEQMRGVALAPE